jgi:glycosyltransferase involved in cell wall biosynthesis
LKIYLTYNDTPSGIFSSQVLDLVNFFNSEFDDTVKLVSYISIRGFFENRKLIKSELPDSIVIPMFPGVVNWRINIFSFRLICFLLKPNAIIGRSVIATQIALKQRKRVKIIYDGRGAITEEWHEYHVITDRGMLNEIESLEKECVLKSDFRMAVSSKLVDLWKDKYSYYENMHVVIPCTLNSLFESTTISNEIIYKRRKELGYIKDDIVFVYSGSLAGWQSINLMIEFIKTVLKKSTSHKILFLSDLSQEIKFLQIEFPNQVQCLKLNPIDLPQYLIACDYGILIREKSVTNQVASPVKFAEYLACGLPVIISNELGDYSEFVKLNECGFILTEFKTYNLEGIFLKEKIQKISFENFSKKNYIEFYKKLFCINTT